MAARLQHVLRFWIPLLGLANSKETKDLLDAWANRLVLEEDNNSVVKVSYSPSLQKHEIMLMTCVLKRDPQNRGSMSEHECILPTCVENGDYENRAIIFKGSL